MAQYVGFGGIFSRITTSIPTALSRFSSYILDMLRRIVSNPVGFIGIFISLMFANQFIDSVFNSALTELNNLIQSAINSFSLTLNNLAPQSCGFGDIQCYIYSALIDLAKYIGEAFLIAVLESFGTIAGLFLTTLSNIIKDQMTALQNVLCYVANNWFPQIVGAYAAFKSFSYMNFFLFRTLYHSLTSGSVRKGLFGLFAGLATPILSFTITGSLVRGLLTMVAQTFGITCLTNTITTTPSTTPPTTPLSQTISSAVLSLYSLSVQQAPTSTISSNESISYSLSALSSISSSESITYSLSLTPVISLSESSNESITYSLGYQLPTSLSESSNESTTYSLSGSVVSSVSTITLPYTVSESYSSPSSSTSSSVSESSNESTTYSLSGSVSSQVSTITLSYTVSESYSSPSSSTSSSISESSNESTTYSLSGSVSSSPTTVSLTYAVSEGYEQVSASLSESTNEPITFSLSGSVSSVINLPYTVSETYTT